MNRGELKEEVKQYQKLAEWHTAKAEELERQIADVKAIRQEAARHRREVRALERKIAQLCGPSGSESKEEK